jgi:hypothetical protein
MEESSTVSVADLTDVVRHVVRVLAPEELEAVDAVADAWLSDQRGNRRSRGAPGGTVGFGVEAVLLSQLLFPIVAGAIGDVLGTIALEPGRLKRKKSKPAAAPNTADPGEASEAAGAGPAVRLTKEQAENLRAACERHALALGLSSARADLLADSVLGSLSR